MNNILKFLARDYSSAFSYYFKYTVLGLVVFLIATFIMMADFFYLAILLFSYLCSYAWVNNDHDANSAVFLNFLPASPKDYVAAKFLFLVITILPFSAIAFAELLFFREYIQLEIMQITNVIVCAFASCLLFGGLSFLGVFSLGTEKLKMVYCLPVFIGVMLSFFAANDPTLGAVLGFFVNSVINSLILLAVSVIVYIVCYFVSAKNFNFKLLIPSSQGR